MVIQRRPANAMAPDPVAIANAMAALQPATPATPANQPTKIAQRFKTREDYLKYYEKAEQNKEYNDYWEWATSDARNKIAPKDYSPSRGSAPNPKLKKFVGQGSGLMITDEDSEINLNAYAIDQEYKKMTQAGATHDEALSELEAAYGRNGYAWPKRPNDYYRGFIPSKSVYDRQGRVIENIDTAPLAVKEGLPRDFLESLVRRNDLIG